MIVTLNTHSVPKELRPYLLMLLDLIIESPIRHGDTVIPYEEVVTALEKDTIAMGTRLGLESNSVFSCGPFSHTASLMIQVETKKYEKGVNWILGNKNSRLIQELFIGSFTTKLEHICIRRILTENLSHF